MNATAEPALHHHSDRRDTDRVPYASRVMIVHGNTAWFAQLLDLSVGGCGVFRPSDCDLAEDQLVRLFFHEGDFQHDDGTASVNIPARIARVEANRIGIEYHEPQSIPPARTR